jgi:thiamine-monophosphate kinase
MTSPHLTPGATLADLGEFGLIAELGRRFPQRELVLLGPGDDAAIVAVPAPARRCRVPRW